MVNLFYTIVIGEFFNEVRESKTSAVTYMIS